MKKLLTLVLSVLLMISVVNAEEKVKVYMFEAGGCPYCEAQEKYLKGLSGYGKTFELIKKELYVDHVEWKEGKDYKLGKKVAEAFNEAGFEDASYEGTPFVVISDLYAAATYSTDLESFINAAVEEGDKDAVTCISNNGENCIRSNKLENLAADGSKINSKIGIVLAIVGGILFIAACVYVFKNHNNEVVSDEEKVEESKVEEVEEAKVEEKVTIKKQPVKKTVKKTVSKKSTTRKPTTKKTVTKK